MDRCDFEQIQSDLDMMTLIQMEEQIRREHGGVLPQPRKREMGPLEKKIYTWVWVLIIDFVVALAVFPIFEVCGPENIAARHAIALAMLVVLPLLFLVCSHPQKLNDMGKWGGHKVVGLTVGVIAQASRFNGLLHQIVGDENGLVFRFVQLLLYVVLPIALGAIFLAAILR
jgi:hypothetical protein